MIEWLTPELWMYINLGALAFILILATLSYVQKDPSTRLLARVLLYLVRLERSRIPQDPEEIGTDPPRRPPGAPMISTNVRKHKPSREGEDTLRELEEKLEDLI